MIIYHHKIVRNYKNQGEVGIIEYMYENPVFFGLNINILYFCFIQMES